MIGSEIRITVVRVEGSQVRLGIEAPADLMVLRAELVGERARATKPGSSPPATAAARSSRSPDRSVGVASVTPVTPYELSALPTAPRSGCSPSTCSRSHPSTPNNRPVGPRSPISTPAGTVTALRYHA